MGTLSLVRHGQASFGSADYDRLSETGARQCEALGRYWAERGRRFDSVITGTLKRHAQSLEAIAAALPGLPPARADAALNEYDAEAIVRAVAGGRPVVTTPEGDRREHFRLLREGLAKWMRGEIEVPGLADWARFSGGVAAWLETLRTSGAAEVLVVSSGGPIATAIAHVLGAPPSAVVALNLQLRNSALSEVTFSPSRHWLVSYNTLPHLDHPERSGWVTFS
ncbi:MAG: histidine phosphatase family protein [Rubrivivax sp.]|nr:histidine phosphatase family protein [Rubrivivax sp.]